MSPAASSHVFHLHTQRTLHFSEMYEEPSPPYLTDEASTRPYSVLW